MALELVVAALLETAFSELLLAVQDARRKISSFQPALKRIESTLETITPLLDAITPLNQQLDLSQHSYGSGIDDLNILVRDVKELVVKCSKIHNLNFVKKIQYSKLLLDLDNNLLRYFMTVHALDRYRDIKKILVALNQLHSKPFPLLNESESSVNPSDEPSGIIMQMEECIQVYEDNENIRKELGITLEDEVVEFVPAQQCSFGVKRQDGVEGSSSLQSLQQETFGFLLDELVGRGHQRRKVISICGMGGIGKTTLAKKLYDRDDVKCHFNAFAWVSVSQTFKTREILDLVLIQLSTSSTITKISEMSDDEVGKELNFVQQKKKCLVIVDDIWREDAWNALKHAFPIEKIAGVILLTTRNRFLGLQVDPNCHIHECQPLSKEESWKLFQQEAFRGRHDYQASTNMENLGRKIVKECSGLPLAIVSIGKLLAGKHSFEEWSLVHKALGMSEMATVDGILTLAAQKLTDFLIKEATFLLCVNDEIESIRSELIWMQSFLKDAEQKQGTDERIRLWVADIRSIAFETEDIIDDFYTEFKRKQPIKRTSLQKFFNIAGETNVYDIRSKFKALKKKLSDIEKKSEVYGINNIGNDIQEIANAGFQYQLLQEQRRTTSHVDDEEHFVGFDVDVKLLETQLFLSEWRRSVISILGMGGLGKTYLAMRLYNTNNYKFELHAWVCVSQEWNIKDLLARIITSFKKPTYEELRMLEKMTDENMKRHLHELLKDKRYLLVIDDIWDEQIWQYLRNVLPNNNKSRVIITTRNESVAELSGGRAFVHKLRRLREHESWELFCKKAFSNRNSACPEDLEKIGKDMVAKCDGLPLAIIVLGGLLSRKQFDEWLVIKQHIWKALIEESMHISALLDLSYDDLSRELKSCFLYLGIFPEDYEIRSDKLIQLWIAEDLIPSREGRCQEELAERYIKELNAKSLIQLNREHDHPTSTCRVHYLLRDLAVNKAKQLDFFHIYDGSVSPSIEPFSTRRIAIRSGFEKYIAIDHSHTRVHTLSFLNYYNKCLDDGDVTKLLALINTRFNSLRVLDLEGVKFGTHESKLKLIEAMGKLVHLRYFGLFESDPLYELPEWIGNLQAGFGLGRYYTTKRHE